ncbi:hypothetical protein M0805_001322 [Coniferiporia weirii]|nr:hypothetical protein M0805_001322 [Coniferiporia weirii]
MPLILLPPLVLLPPSCDFVGIDVECPALIRPSLSTNSSYSSSSTACSSKASRKKAYRPSLTPEDLRAHAFGPRLHVRDTVNVPIVQPTRSSSLSSVECSSSRSPMSESRRKRYNLPSPPPRGTFRSATLIPESARLTCARSSSHGEGERSMQEPCGSVEREPPMLPGRWRQKADERLERRKLWRTRLASEGSDGSVQPLPLGIDCRPMEGSMGLPPSSDLPRIRKTRSRNMSADSGIKLDGLRSQVIREQTPANGERLARAPLDRSMSMVELNEINDLAERCDELDLSNSTIVPEPEQVRFY